MSSRIAATDPYTYSLQMACRIPPGEPLTPEHYERARRHWDGPSLARVMDRYGSWRMACRAAGVTPGMFEKGRRVPRAG